MSDPRSENCRALSVGAGGKVEGVELVYYAVPDGKYECVRAELVGEALAGGQTIATVNVLDRENLPVVARVYLAWPWDGEAWRSRGSFANMALPGNGRTPVEHVIVNGYDANQVRGPLAICVGSCGELIDSDVVAGLGLPWNRHVSYALTFRERGGGVGVPGGGGFPTPYDLAVILDGMSMRIGALEARLAAVKGVL